MSDHTRYRSRLVECDVCGRLRTRDEVGPTMTYDPSARNSNATYMDVLRCRDRSECVTRPPDPENDGRVVVRRGMVVVR